MSQPGRKTKAARPAVKRVALALMILLSGGGSIRRLADAPRQPAAARHRARCRRRRSRNCFGRLIGRQTDQGGRGHCGWHAFRR